MCKGTPNTHLMTHFNVQGISSSLLMCACKGLPFKPTHINTQCQRNSYFPESMPVTAHLDPSASTLVLVLILLYLYFSESTSSVMLALSQWMERIILLNYNILTSMTPGPGMIKIILNKKLAGKPLLGRWFFSRVIK